jgi:hypothetical protein
MSTSEVAALFGSTEGFTAGEPNIQPTERVTEGEDMDDF